MNKRIYLSPERRPRPHGRYWGMEAYEKDVCEELASLLAPLLAARGFGARIGAPEKDLAARVGEAIAWGADYYLPIHTNASTGGAREGTARGPLVLAYDHPAAKAACRRMYDSLLEVYPCPERGRGVQVSRDFYEIIRTPMVSVYPEIAFHDNGEDARWLVENKGEIARALCRGVCRWYGVWDPLIAKSPGAPAESSGPWR